ncbi:hypothetical protein TNCV_2210041 [Trichonephila clavipes]|nr:hypothetical protein TNCV_2210041 [Trichonephila clavipes]
MFSELNTFFIEADRGLLSISEPITAWNSKLSRRYDMHLHVREYSSPSSSIFLERPFCFDFVLPSPINTEMSFESFEGSMIPLLTSSRMSVKLNCRCQ